MTAPSTRDAGRVTMHGRRFDGAAVEDEAVQIIRALIAPWEHLSDGALRVCAKGYLRSLMGAGDAASILAARDYLGSRT